MTRDEKVKAMLNGTYSNHKKPKTTHAVTKRPTDPVYPKPKHVEMGTIGTSFVLRYECECFTMGHPTLVPETAKACPACKRVNPTWAISTFSMSRKKFEE